MFLILFLQSFFWVVQDGIIFLNNHVSILDLHQDCLRTPRNYWDFLEFHPFYFTFMEDPFYYWNFFFRGSRHCQWRVKWVKLILRSQESGFIASSRPSLLPLFCTVAPIKAFINRAKGSLYCSTTKAQSSFHLWSFEIPLYSTTTG